MVINLTGRVGRSTCQTKIFLNYTLFSRFYESGFTFKRDQKLFREKYKDFNDNNAPIIYDIEEEKSAYKTLAKKDISKNISGAALKRGLNGVFEIEELVNILREDNAQDICTIEVPKELMYVDYLTVATGKSIRHILGLSEFVRQTYKKKMSSSDIIPRIESNVKSEWIALDLGNIALHILSERLRKMYDIESLWSVGSDFDLASRQSQNSVIEVLKKHSLTLDGLHPS